MNALISSSSSRLIAFFIGSYLPWALFNDRGAEAVKAFDAVEYYFFCGSALYAPHALNQLKSAFKG